MKNIILLSCFILAACSTFENRAGDSHPDYCVVPMDSRAPAQVESVDHTELAPPRATECSSIVKNAPVNGSHAVLEFPLVAHARKADLSFEKDKQFIKFMGGFPQDLDEPIRENPYPLIRETVERFGNNKKIKTVVYPLSGFDAQTPFQIYPDADVVYGIDGEPFMSPEESGQTVEYFPLPYNPARSSYSTIGQVMMQKTQVKPLLTRLAGNIKGFRLRQVEGFRISGAKEIPRTRSQGGKYVTEPAVPMHGLIEFDTGPGTPARKYYHINDVFSAEDNIENRWWYKDVLGHIDGMLVKASMGQLKSVSIEGAFLHLLESSHGILVEDGSAYGGMTTSDATQPPGIEVPLGPNSIEIHLSKQEAAEKAPFGYNYDGGRINGPLVKITKF